MSCKKIPWKCRRLVVGTGIGNAYYPPTSSTWVKTYQRWGTQLALDGAGDILKEFWPEINRAIFHNKY